MSCPGTLQCGLFVPSTIFGRAPVRKCWDVHDYLETQIGKKMNYLSWWGSINMYDGYIDYFLPWHTHLSSAKCPFNLPVTMNFTCVDSLLMSHFLLGRLDSFDGRLASMCCCLTQVFQLRVTTVWSRVTTRRPRHISSHHVIDAQICKPSKANSLPSGKLT